MTQEVRPDRPEARSPLRPDGGTTPPVPPEAEPPAAVPPGWYPNPDLSPTLRYWDGQRWTGGVSPPIIPPYSSLVRRGRRRAIWILLAILAAVLLLVGLEYALESRDTYSADMTKGHGDFPASVVGDSSTAYRADGFHLRIEAAGGFRPSGVALPRAYSSTEVTARAVEVSAPPDAAFGPWCFRDVGDGEGMELSADGWVDIVRLSGGDRTVIAGGRAPTWRPGTTSTLKLVCRVDIGSIEVSGYVDGTRVAQVTDAYSTTLEIDATGVAGWVPAGSPAAGEWVLTTFSRRVPG